MLFEGSDVSSTLTIHRLIWGGKTTESKANLNRLVDAGEFDYLCRLTEDN